MLFFVFATNEPGKDSVAVLYVCYVTVAGAGVVTYLMDGKSQGLELIGAGVGLGVLPYVLSATQPKTASNNVWV